MISIIFHKQLSAILIQKLESFCHSFTSIGLHQALAFSKAMEPKRQQSFCVAQNEEYEIFGFCIIHYSFPLVSIQDGPISKNDAIICLMIDSIRKRYNKRFFAFTTIQLPYACTALAENSKNKTVIENYFNYQNWSTSIIELFDLHNLSKNLSKGHLSAIKKAEKWGITVSNDFSNQTILTFSVLFDETYKTRKIKAQWNNTESYFIELSKQMNLTKSFFIGAYLENKLVAGGIFLTQGDTVHYKYGSSNHQMRSIPLMHSVLFNAMVYAQKQGFRFFDLGGINLSAPEGSQVYAINTFKKGFGGNIISSPKRIYFANNRVSLAIVLLLLKLKKYIHK